MRKCVRCGIERPDDLFSKGNSSCKICHRELSRLHYKKHTDRYKKNQLDKLKVRGQYLYKYLLKNPCIDCGETDPSALDFDHRDINEKKDHISKMFRDSAWQIVLEEVKKCDIRCANCHRKKTAKQFNWYKGFLK